MTDTARRCNRFGRLASGALTGLLASVSPALAVQSHGGAEGLVAHQIGHLLFTVGMGYLLYRISRGKLKGPGWVEFRLFLWLLLAWNLLTFAGHWMNEFVTAEQFIRTNGQTLAFRISDNWDTVFYLAQLDHLVLVPAMACLLLALRKWRVT